MAERKQVRKVKKTDSKETAPKVAATTQKAAPRRGDNLTVDVLDASGKVVNTLELNKEVFGVKPNKALLAQAVRVYLANQRLGNASTKTRGEVRGGGRKPWRQKGTGRARTGSIRDPHWRGGGVVHGPKRRDFSLDLPKKMRRAALASALSDKLQERALLVLKEINFKEAKTKEAAKLLKNLEIKENSLLADTKFEEKETKALRNLKNTKIMPARNLNTYEILQAKKLLITSEGVAEIEKLLVK